MENLADRPTTHVRGYEVRDGLPSPRDIEAVLEEPLSLVINGSQAAVLMRLPGMEKELAAGFVVSEGFVADFRDVLTIHHCGRALPELDATPDGAESRNRVEVVVRPEGLCPERRDEAVRLIRAGCGAVDVAAAELSLPVLEEGVRVDLDILCTLAQGMHARQHLRREVGGVHAAGIFALDGGVVAVAEDIGRHNAADKAIGHCLLRGIRLEDKILLSSGRLSYEMVSKAVRARVPVIVSVSAPTSLAVALAARSNVGLVGYLRGRHMTIYAHAERFGLDAPTEGPAS